MKKLCSLDELEPGAGREFRSAQGWVVLIRGASGVCAWLNSCPHQGRSLNLGPDEFLFTPEGRLMCPHHGAVFDVDSGSCLDGPCKGSALTAVALSVDDGEIYLAEP
jgi:nitrite reductase/ring-hydroxylating ferredoxin subunit